MPSDILVDKIEILDGMQYEDLMYMINAILHQNNVTFKTKRYVQHTKTTWGPQTQLSFLGRLVVNSTVE